MLIPFHPSSNLRIATPYINFDSHNISCKFYIVTLISAVLLKTFNT
jgi:hypothetical protein